MSVIVDTCRNISSHFIVITIQHMYWILNIGIIILTVWNLYYFHVIEEAVESQRGQDPSPKVAGQQIRILTNNIK